jgi:hypothetical protein
MNPKCAFPNTQSAATRLHRCVKNLDVPLKLTARPYNRFEPVNSLWWLIPSSEWPAYRYGKYFFWARNENRDLYCGFYVEKGLDPNIAVAFPSGKQLVMDNTWTWHRVLKDIGTGTFGAKLDETVKRSGRSALLIVSGGFVEDPASYDPHAPPMDWNEVAFEYDGATPRCASSKGDAFSHLTQSTDLTELVKAIQAIPHLAWTWVNFYVGWEFEFVSLDHDEEQMIRAWDATELWEKCLAPWQLWIV